jgi:PhnB protein
MKPLVAYLNFNGNCREAMTFYAQCLGAELELVPFGDMPHPGVPAEAKDLILHARLHKGDGQLMASDTMPGMPFVQGTNFSVSVHPVSGEECDSVWRALSQGATIQQPLADAPWGARYGSLTDKFGVQWMLNYEYPK